MAATTPRVDPSLFDLTNFYRREGFPTGLPTPPSERKRVRQLNFDGRDKKRVKVDASGKKDTGDGPDTDTDTDIDSEDDNESVTRWPRRDYQHSVYASRIRGMLAGPSGMTRTHFAQGEYTRQSLLPKPTTRGYSVYKVNPSVIRLIPQGRRVQVPIN